MFSKSIIACVALMASSAMAEAIGSAVVVNKCAYQVYMCNTPAADGGYTDIPMWLDANTGTYEQTWTELTNGDGWSIKLSNSTDMSNIMQYEYTFHNDGGDIIWYDLSDVNGNPWDGDWEITASSASGECNPKQQAYRYATDDAYGMQACPQDSVITVTLCSGESSDDGGAASASSSAAAQTSVAATQSSTFVTPSASAPTQYTWVATGGSSASSTVEASPAVQTSSSTAAATTSSAVPSTTVQSTTFATSTLATRTFHHGGVTVTEVETAVVTNVVTQTYWHHPSKRHDHHRRHAGDRS